jgi:ABC transporter substrate binding protein
MRAPQRVFAIAWLFLAQFAMDRSLVPTLKVIGVMYDPEKTSALVKEAGEVAERFGLQVLPVPVASQTKVPAALRGLLGKVDAPWLLPDDTVVTQESLTFLLLTAFKQNLPVLTVSEAFVEAGAFAALSPDYCAHGQDPDSRRAHAAQPGCVHRVPEAGTGLRGAHRGTPRHSPSVSRPNSTGLRL